MCGMERIGMSWKSINIQMLLGHTPVTISELGLPGHLSNLRLASANLFDRARDSLAFL